MDANELKIRHLNLLRKIYGAAAHKLIWENTSSDTHFISKIKDEYEIGIELERDFYGNTDYILTVFDNSGVLLATISMGKYGKEKVAINLRELSVRDLLAEIYDIARNDALKIADKLSDVEKRLESLDEDLPF